VLLVEWNVTHRKCDSLEPDFARRSSSTATCLQEMSAGPSPITVSQF
jgi:hypothetical protein